MQGLPARFSEIYSVIYLLKIDFPLFPKPRGNIGKTMKGRAFIYHSTREYTNFKKAIKESAQNKALPGKDYWGYPLGITVVESFIPQRTESDLDNCLGGLLDALVQSGFLIDDSRKFIQHKQYFAVESDRSYCYVLIYPLSEIDQALTLSVKYVEMIRDHNILKLYRNKY